jgi:hypothetical protein
MRMMPHSQRPSSPIEAEAAQPPAPKRVAWSILRLDRVT